MAKRALAHWNGLHYESEIESKRSSEWMRETQHKKVLVSKKYLKIKIVFMYNFNERVVCSTCPLFSFALNSFHAAITDDFKGSVFRYIFYSIHQTELRHT